MEGVIENEETSRYLHLLADSPDAEANERLDEVNGTLTLTVVEQDARALAGFKDMLGKRVTFDLSDEPGKPVRWWTEEGA